MNLIICGSNKGRTRHYFDIDNYKTLCEKERSEIVVYNAAYFNYEAMYPTLCKKCQKIFDKLDDKSSVS
jgi:hypothetical protein